ncbi:MAG: hypothetical protein M5R42_15725 [Rhodocyclaceae bacterium]|jgi:hypothetical protein|nr:hypothetical protein [Rhodocyclaceae bacterium]
MTADTPKDFSAKPDVAPVATDVGKAVTIAPCVLQGERGEAMVKLIHLLARQAVADYLRERGQGT